MNQNPPNPHAAPKAPAVLFDHEKLDVYQMELKFIAWVTPLLDEVAKLVTGKTREVCDQLDRASLSTLLNTAEGNGKRQRQVRAKFFDDARGSATECAACLDALLAKQLVVEARTVEGKKMLLRIVSMLCGLIERFDTPAALHDEMEAMTSDNSPTEPPAEKVNYLANSSRSRTWTRTSRI